MVGPVLRRKELFRPISFSSWKNSVNCYIFGFRPARAEVCDFLLLAFTRP
jgi:hypothetical protein